MNSALLSVIIPAHNEEKNITTAVSALSNCLSGRHIPHEIVIINDNSTDATGAVAREMGLKNPSIKVFDRAPPNGFGRAIRAGIENSIGDIVVFYMSDASDSPEDVIKYYDAIGRGYDCVFGSRFMKGSRCNNYPKSKLLANRIVNRMMQLMFFSKYNDLTNAFKAYRRNVLQECGPFKASHFNITIELSLNALIRNYNITQMPIQWEGRTWGSSSLHLHEMGRRYLSTLLKIFFEKVLIRDDLIDESLTVRTRKLTHDPVSERISSLEDRVGKLESTLN